MPAQESSTGGWEGYPTPRHQGDLNERWWLSGINTYAERQKTLPQVYVVLECKQTGCETQ